MSLTSWKKEFYPIPASKTTKANALAHSLQKWKGARVSALDKHSLRLSNAVLLDGMSSFDFTNKTCSLCFHHYKRGDETPCAKCPLFAANGNRNCYDRYDIFVMTDSPRQMIALLEKAIKLQKQK